MTEIYHLYDLYDHETAKLFGTVWLKTFVDINHFISTRDGNLYKIVQISHVVDNAGNEQVTKLFVTKTH
jgi:hypothetical protein